MSTLCLLLLILLNDNIFTLTSCAVRNVPCRRLFWREVIIITMRIRKNSGTKSTSILWISVYNYNFHTKNPDNLTLRKGSLILKICFALLLIKACPLGAAASISSKDKKRRTWKYVQRKMEWKNGKLSVTSAFFCQGHCNGPLKKKERIKIRTRQSKTRQNYATQCCKNLWSVPVKALNMVGASLINLKI